MRRFLWLILVSAILLSIVAPRLPVIASTKEFIDVNPEYWAYMDILRLTKYRIIDGYPDRRFKPEENVTRGQFCKIIMLTLAILEILPENEINTDKSFNDVQDHWAKGYIEKAYSLGLIKGYPDGTFKPDANISKAEILAIIARSLNWPNGTGGHFSDMDGHWAYGPVEACYAHEVIKTPDPYICDGTYFHPDWAATRAQTVVFVSRMIDAKLPEIAKEYYNKILPILNKFDDDYLLASQTPRVSLAPIISLLQEDVRKMTDEGATDIFELSDIYRSLCLGMQETTLGLIDFLGGGSGEGSLTGYSKVTEAEEKLLEIVTGKWKKPKESPSPTPAPSSSPSTSTPTSNQASSQVQVTSVLFALKIDDQKHLINPSTSFPAGSTRIYAELYFFGAAPNKTKLTVRLYKENWLKSEYSLTLPQQDGNCLITFTSDNGFEKGSYKLEIWIDNNFVRSSYFSVY